MMIANSDPTNCHQVNRAGCKSVQDDGGVRWMTASDWNFFTKTSVHGYCLPKKSSKTTWTGVKFYITRPLEKIK